MELVWGKNAIDHDLDLDRADVALGLMLELVKYHAAHPTAYLQAFSTVSANSRQSLHCDDRVVFGCLYNQGKIPLNYTWGGWIDCNEKGEVPLLIDRSVLIRNF